MTDRFRRALPTEGWPPSPPCDPDTKGLGRLVATVTIMKPEEMKMAVVIAWALIWSVVAVSLVSSVSNWILVVASGVLPPLMILRMWHPPARTVPVRHPRRSPVVPVFSKMTKRTTQETVARTQRTRTIRDLSELIAALDRRVPQVERSGEVSIARAAARLKGEAVQRIADLERALTKNS